MPDNYFFPKSLFYDEKRYKEHVERSWKIAMKAQKEIMNYSGE